MEDTTEYFTKEKYDELTKELELLKTQKRKEIAEHLEYAKSLGDLSENAEYHEARSEQANVEDRIMRLENMLKSAQIVSVNSHDIVEVGSTVTVLHIDTKDEKTYTLVGSEEADILQGKLSMRSPIGSAMIGKKKGDTFKCKTPNGEANCKILDVK